MPELVAPVVTEELVGAASERSVANRVMMDESRLIGTGHV